MNYGQMLWINSFFVHWQVPEVQLRPYIPKGLELDLFEGNAYLSLVALRAIGPAPWPLLPLGSIFLSYNQLNIRTYVAAGPERGIILLDTLVSRCLPAFGARLLGMPYRSTSDLNLKADADHISLHAPGLDIEGEVSDVAPAPVPSGSLESFLTDRFWVYARLPGGLVYGVRIRHAPWRLRPVSLVNPLPSSAIGISGAAVPVMAYLAEKQDVSIVDIHTVRWPAGLK